MEPLIEPGALLLVDESDVDHRRSPKPRKASDHNNIYVFLQDGALRVKRVRVDRKGATIALSDNPAYDPEILHKQDFKVLGRVIWWDNRLWSRLGPSTFCGGGRNSWSCAQRRNRRDYPRGAHRERHLLSRHRQSQQGAWGLVSLNFRL
jgi:hypothetical protein